MSKKYVSINRILEEVFQNEGYSHEADWGDAISWAGKALGLINAPAIYIAKKTGTNILTPHIVCENYRGSLPIDFVDIIANGVKDSTTGQIYKYSGNLDPNYGGPTYVVKGGYIDISEETATLELDYTAFMIDEDGFPMIPDVERVIEAVRSFITYRMDHRLWRQNKLERAVYEESKVEWLWYVGSAQNALRITDPERRMVWTKYWTQVLPTMMSKDAETEEDIKEDYSGYARENIIYPNLPSTP